MLFFPNSSDQVIRANCTFSCRYVKMLRRTIQLTNCMDGAILVDWETVQNDKLKMRESEKVTYTHTCGGKKSATLSNHQVSCVSMAFDSDMEKPNSWWQQKICTPHKLCTLTASTNKSYNHGLDMWTKITISQIDTGIRNVVNNKCLVVRYK